MKSLENIREKNTQSGITMIILAFTIVLLIIIAGITISTSTGDSSLLEKTEQDANKYNQQVEKYSEEYNGLTKSVDEKEDIKDSMPEDF